MMQRFNVHWNIPPGFPPPESTFPEPRRELQDIGEISLSEFPDFIARIGLVGMGGSGFNAAQKIRAGKGAHTLVINAVECEPGITIDQTVLLHHAIWVKAGAQACAKAVGTERIVLAVKNDRKLLRKIEELYPEFEIKPCSKHYPAGAEKLIVSKLEGRMPPPGMRPYQLGYLIQNVVSLRAIGRALLDGIPVVERPLTLAMPSCGFYRNIIAPVNALIWDLLDTYKLPCQPDRHIIISSGLMMGCEVSANDCIEKTTTSIIVLDQEPRDVQERACIRCGACNSACPLGLHPFPLSEAVKQGEAKQPKVEVQLTECFLCGACSAVCPSNLPLVQTFMEGKRCLR